MAKSNSNGGFTLLEIAIAMLIIGIFLGTALPILTMYEKKKRFDVTHENLQNAENALKVYLHANRALPCPAARDIKRGEIGFGKALTKCYNPNSVGLFNDVNANVTSTFSAKGAHDEWVITGLLPFRSLGIADSAAQDGWGDILNYAVTEKLTDPFSYGASGGAIDVVDENKKSRIVPAGSLQFVLYSSGEDGKGAITSEGVAGPECDKDLLEGENCNHGAVFLVTSFRVKPLQNWGGAPGRTVTDFDDILLYQQFDLTETTKGIIFQFTDDCPADFTPIKLNPDIQAGTDVPVLSKSYNPGTTSQALLCYSPYYSASISLNLLNPVADNQICPDGWTMIGYRTDSTNTVAMCVR